MRFGKSDRLNKIPLRFGDLLLVQGAKQSLLGLQITRELLVIEQKEPEAIRRNKAWIAIGIILGVILIAAFDLLPILRSCHVFIFSGSQAFTLKTADRRFSLIIALLVLPFLFPMPPGLSGVMGIGCLVLGMQITLGRKYPWLPKQVAKLEFPRSLSQKLLKHIRRFTVWLEKIVRSRWQQVANNSYTSRINGCCIAWLSILLMLAIPLTNLLPAIAILLLAIALRAPRTDR